VRLGIDELIQNVAQLAGRAAQFTHIDADADVSFAVWEWEYPAVAWQ